jgi:hypothetical protein
VHLNLCGRRSADVAKNEHQRNPYVALDVDSQVLTEFNIYRNPCPFGCGQRSLSNGGLELGRVGRFLCGIRRLGGDFGVIPHQAQLSQEHANLGRSGAKEEKSEDGGNRSGYSTNPIEHRFFIALVLVFLFFVLCLVGGKAPYNDRLLLGAALIGFGWLFSGAQIGLLWSVLPSSWEWPG